MVPDVLLAVAYVTVCVKDNKKRRNAKYRCDVHILVQNIKNVQYDQKTK
jgi:hypothetical protein